MITIIFGANGFGKSSLMNFFLNESAFDVQRIRQGNREIEYLNERYNLSIPGYKHLTFCSETSIFKKTFYSSRQNLVLEPGKLGIQDEAPEGVECQFIPPCATLGIDEAQTWFSSREGHVQNYQASFFAKHRHNNLDIYLTTPRAIDIDKRIRALSSGIYVKDKKVNFYDNGKVKIEWYVDLIDVCMIDKYLEAGPKEIKYFSNERVIRCNYNVFDIYDSRSCQDDFIIGYKNYYPKYKEI